MKPEPTSRAWPPVRGAAFADAVARRHGAARLARPVERVLHGSARPGITQAARSVFALGLTARFALSIAAAARTLPGGVREVLRERERVLAREARVLRRERSVERLRERELRHSSLEHHATTRIAELLRQARSPAPAAAAKPAPAAGRGRVARVLAHPAATPPAAAPVPRPAEAGRAIAAGWRIDAGTPAPAAAPAVDVNHLAREVMRSLDERILAHRERLGRS